MDHCENFTLVEKFNPNVMKSLINHEGLSYEEKSQLKKYYKKRFDGNKVKVQYLYGKTYATHQIGRIYAEKGLGLQMFNRDIRNALARDYYDDIDIVNAMPTILLELCYKHGWACDNLKFYVENRNVVIDELKTIYSWEFEEAKKYIASFVFFKPLDEENEKCKFVIDFSKEMNVLVENVKNKYIDIWTIVSKMRKNYNKNGTFMSLVLQEEERKIMMEAISFINSIGRVFGCLIHDGGCVEKVNSGDISDFLDNVSKHVNKVLNYSRIKFICKPMTTTFDLSSIEDEENNETFELLDGKLRDYDVVKKKFEESCFKCRNPFAYCEVNDEGLVVMRKADTFVKLWENLFTIKTKFDKNGNLVSEKELFVKAWYKDPKCRTFEKVVFKPPPLKVKANEYNIWKGFAIDTIDCESSGNIEPFLNQIKIQAGGNDKEADFIIKWFADFVQNPGRVNGIILVIVGEEGVGKNFTFCQMSKMFGRDFYYETPDPENDLFSRFSNARLRGLLICIDEGKKKAIFGNRDKLWNMITNETWNYEQKGFDKIVMDNYNHFVITTNDALVIPFGRRPFIVNALSEKMGDKKYFVETAKYFDDPCNQKAIIEYLRGIDISEVNWIEDKPETEIMNGLASLTGCEVLRFLESNYNEKIKHNLTEWIIQYSSLENSFMTFLKEDLKYRELNEKEWRYKFQVRMAANIKNSKGGITKKLLTQKKLTHYIFDLPLLKPFLEIRGFLRQLPEYMFVDDDEVDEVDEYD
jgi:hypothetical protein